MTDIKSCIESEGINLRFLSHKERRSLIKKYKRKLKRQEIGKARKNTTKMLSEEIQCIKSKIHHVESLRKSLEKTEHRFQECVWRKKSREFENKIKLEKSNNSEPTPNDNEVSNISEISHGKINPPQIEKLYHRSQSSEAKKSNASDSGLNSRNSIGVSENHDPYHNPFPPDNQDNNHVHGNCENSQENSQDICFFFSKTGVCKFGENCNKIHTSSFCFTDIANANINTSTLLIRNMFDKVGLTTSMSYEGEDVTLENDDVTIYNDFKEFYNDVYPEFAKFGSILDFRVCSNHQKHLRGNVYIKYRTQEECIKSFSAFNGRLYNSRRIICEFCCVKNFDAATCHMLQKCPKGNDCNFWHVFKNPGENRKRKNRVNR